MHINLILGAVFLLALWWVTRQWRAQRKAAKTQPAEMLRDELSRRREAMSKIDRAAERLAALKKEKAAEIFAGLDDMLEALPAEAHDINSQNKGDEVIFSLKYLDKTETFHLAWDIRHFDLELFAGKESLKNAQGDYIVRMPDGSNVRDANFASFMRTLSGLIADRLIARN